METGVKKYNWAIAGCGAIANQMGDVCLKAGTPIFGIANRTKEKAIDFAAKYGVENVYDGFSDMFADPAVDIVYIATPHNTHVQYIREALKAGKHVLCEKAITLNSKELEEVKALAAEKHLVLAEAQTIYHMPLYRELTRRLTAGDFGDVNVITMNFGSFKDFDPSRYYFRKDLAGGSMLDIGVYALSCARLFLKSCPD